jgi:hypothetical protein
MMFARWASAMAVVVSAARRRGARELAASGSTWFIAHGRPVVFFAAAGVVLLALIAA